MSSVPKVLDEGRAGDAALVAATGIGQAAGAGLAAFATRDLFSALHGGMPLAWQTLATLLAGGIMVAALRIVQRTVAERLGQNFAISLRRRLYRHLAGMSSSAVAGRRTGALSLRFVGDMSAARGWVSLGLTRLVSACFVLPGAAIALYLLNPVLAAAAAVPIGLTLIVMAGFATVLEPLHQRLRGERANIAISMMERVGIAPELDVIGRTRRDLKALVKNGEAMRSSAVARARAASCLRAVPEIGSAFAGIALFWSTFWIGAPAAEAAGALAVLGILLLPLRELAGVWDRRCAWVIARRKCNVVFATPSSIRKRRKTAGATGVQFESVRFRGLDITAMINPGESVLVSGPFGSGKTSLLALAVGLEAPESGRVTFGEQEHQPQSVMIRPQSPVLQGSLRRAVTLGTSKRPADETIEATARRFGLGPLLERLGGLDARVGEGGRTLSSGERLRLHLTRASLMKPDLLAIDATEMALDADAMAAIHHLVAKTVATTLIAADQSLAPLVDRHWRIEAGRLTEQSPQEPARQLPFPRPAA